jgi:epoxyqueuosine reductase
MSSARSTGSVTIDTGQLLELGRHSGLAAVGVAEAAILQPALSVIEHRKRAGLAGDMQFTYRNPARSCDPSRLLPSARSIIAGAWAYGQWRRPTRPHTAEPSSGPTASVARYTWHDHYGDLRQALQPMADRLTEAGFRAVVVADSNALVDRNVAWLAGLGWYGKNSNLLLPGSGSWYVLGAVVTDAQLDPTGPPLEDGCGSCSQCIDDCPTAAIVAPGVVDATRCLAWLVQAGGSIPIEFREAVADRIYGCDDCQDVCPPNRLADRAPADPGPKLERGVKLEVELDQAQVSVEWVLTADDEAIEARHGRWYIADRDINVIRRTALVVLGNTATPGPTTQRLLEQYLASDSTVLRAHAAWAARRLGRPDLLDALPAGSIPEDELAAPVVERFTVDDWPSSPERP